MINRSLTLDDNRVLIRVAMVTCDICNKRGPLALCKDWECRCEILAATTAAAFLGFMCVGKQDDHVHICPKCHRALDTGNDQ